MLGHAAPTPYDLRFQLFGIPVRVTPWFWLLAALLGWAPGRLDLVAVWIGCVFLSILVHEFGHALTARAFGWPPQIVLYHFGGYASYTPTSRNTPTRGAIVSFAGPAAGFVLCFLAFACGLVMIANRLTAPPLITAALFDLVWINLVWGIFNLMPVYPLDGGQISRHLFNGWLGNRGIRYSLVLSMVAAACLAALGFMLHQPFMAIFMGSFGVSNYQEMQAYSRGRWY